MVETVSANSSVDEELIQPNNTTYKFCRTVKRIGKFFVALLLYLVLNALLCVLFNYTKSVSTEIFALIGKGLRAFLSNSLLPVVEIALEMRSLSSIYALVIFVCITMLSLFVTVVTCKRQTIGVATIAEDRHRVNSANTKAGVSFYKQQVHYLS